MTAIRAADATLRFTTDGVTREIPCSDLEITLDDEDAAPPEPVPRYFVSPNAYKRMERFYALGRDERPVERRRRQQTSTALRHLRRRAWRRIARITGYSGSMKRWWRRQWRGIDTSHTPTVGA